MPSRLHEVLIEMVRQRPELVADLLAGPPGVDVPAFQKALLSPGELTDVVPTEYRADAVVTFYDGDDPVLAVVVEVQLRTDPMKRRTWPAYVATVHARLGCLVSLLVLCPTQAVADWCATPIRTGNPGLVLTTIAVGPGQVPIVTDLEEARQKPELTVLSALAHGGQDDPEPVLRALFAAVEEIDLEHAKLYTDLVVMVLPAVARGCLEEIMTTAAQEHGSEFADAYLPRTFARGRTEGKAEGKVEALLAILETRAIEASDDLRNQITTCTDAEQLDIWIRRAATASRIEDLFTG